MKNKENKIVKNKIYGKNILYEAQECTNNLYEELSVNDDIAYEEFMQLLEQSFYANKSKRKLQIGESCETAVLANMLDGEISKKSAKLICDNYGLANQVYEAYMQSKVISDYLKSKDVFKFSQDFITKLNQIVDSMLVGNEDFKQVVSLGLNFAQSTCIYGIDFELSRKKLKEKRLTDFEKILVNEPLNGIVQVMDILIELGQSEYIALFGGRCVCTGYAGLTASFLDLCFHKLGINASASLTSNDEHAFVTLKYNDKIFVVDPTQYLGTFKDIKKADKDNATYVKDAHILKLKKYDKDAHFKVVEYYLKELNVVAHFKNVDFAEPTPIKLTRILSQMEKSMSKMSALVHPKAVMIDGREMSTHFYFELCLNALCIPYETGINTTDFIIKDNFYAYYVDIDKAFNAHNELRKNEKFIVIKPISREKAISKGQRE